MSPMRVMRFKLPIICCFVGVFSLRGQLNLAEVIRSGFGARVNRPLHELFGLQALLLRPVFNTDYAAAIPTRAAALFVILAILLTVVIVFQKRQNWRMHQLLVSQAARRSRIFEFWEHLVSSPPERLAQTITTGFENVLDFGIADRMCWYELNEVTGSVVPVYSACARGVSIPAEPVEPGQTPSISERLSRHDIVSIEDVEGLAAGAETDKQFLSAHGVKSLLLIPSTYSTRRKGVLGLASLTRCRKWPPDLTSQLAFLGNIIGATLERRDAEEASRESEERFRYLFQQATFGIALETLDGRILNVNPALCGMMGYSEEEFLEISCADITHPDDAAAEEALFSELKQGLRLWYRIEKRFLCKDGSEIWGEVHVSLLEGTNRGPLVVGIVRDITLQKAAEEGLRASEARLHSTLDVLSSRIAILDETGAVLAANANWRRVSGENVPGCLFVPVGTNFLKACAATNGQSGETANEVARRARSLMNGEAQGEPILQKWAGATGEDGWFRVMMTRFQEMGKPRVVVSYQDITELMRTRNALEKNQEHLSLALEASHTGTWEWSCESNQVRWKDNQGLIFGPEEGEYVGDYRRLFDYVHPDDRQTVRDLAEQTLGSGSSFSSQFRVVDRQRTTHWILAKGKIARDQTGRAVRMVGVNVDISELKRRDNELQKLARRLIEAQEEERHRISRELHDDIGQRVFLVACELEMRRQALVALKQDRESNQLKKVQRELDQLSTDIHELSHQLHSSKLQHCGLAVALKELCEKHSKNNGPVIELSARGVDSDVPPDVALCLFRVAQEALSNAVKHSLARKILVQVDQHLGRVCLTIKDEGKGFDPTIQSEGIGLTSMRERLRIIGGELLVKSSPNEGTEVSAAVNVPEAAMQKAAAAKGD